MIVFHEAKSKGKRKLLERIDTVKKAKGYTIHIKNKNTTGFRYKPTKPRSKPRRTTKESISRTAAKNTTILRTQAKEGRNVVFLEKNTKNRLLRMFNDALFDILEKNNSLKLNRVVIFAASKLIKTYISHIIKSKGKKGELKPNKRSTIDRKVRDASHGKVDKSKEKDLTPLRHTGQLEKSFYFEVKKNGDKQRR